MKKLWYVGQLKGEYNEKGSVWEFQGIFDTEEAAKNSCKNKNYFIGTAILNEELPDESYVDPESYYPLR